jgi:hypothetical protein
VLRPAPVLCRIVWPQLTLSRSRCAIVFIMGRNHTYLGGGGRGG